LEGVKCSQVWGAIECIVVIIREFIVSSL